MISTLEQRIMQQNAQMTSQKNELEQQLKQQTKDMSSQKNELE